MSDDPPPPDLIRTAEFPLDELSVELLRQAEPTTPPPAAKAGPGALFGAVRTVGPRVSIGAGEQDGMVLEGSERPFATRIAPTETIHKIRTFLAARRDHTAPLHRKQGILAVIGLCLLAIVVTLSLPRSGATLGSDVEVRNDDLEPAAPVGSDPGSNRDDTIDAIGSDGLFSGSKTERALGQPDDEQPSSTELVTDRSRTGATETTTASEQLPTLEELFETSVVVGPSPTCPDPLAVPPDCVPSTTAPPTTPSTAAPTTARTEPPTTVRTTTTAPTTTVATTAKPTTVKPTTTKPSTTKPTTTKPSTTKPSTTASTTTTGGSSTGPSTTPTTGDSTTGSTSSSSTTTTDGTTPEATTPGGPNESPGPIGTAVACTPGTTTPGQTVPPSEPGLPGLPGQTCHGSATSTTQA